MSGDRAGSRGRAMAERMATPWFGINAECYEQSWAELEVRWQEPELIAACAGLAVPVLIIDGAADLRPRSAVDSLERALPEVSRVVLPGTGHMPWLDAPAAFATAVRGFLNGLPVGRPEDGRTGQPGSGIG